MPLIICRVELSLKWDKNCILSCKDGNSVFAITDAYVPILTLSAEDNVKLSKLLGEGFKIPIYQNQYKVIPDKTYNANRYIRELLDSSYQGVNRLFVLADDNTNRITPNSHKRYSLPRTEIENQNIEIDGRNFYNQPINDLINQYDQLRKVSTGQGGDYTTGCLLDFVYFKKNTN